MKNSLSVTALVAAMALFVAYAYGQQSGNDPGMNGRSGSRLQMTQNPDTVKQVQQALNSKGFDPGPVNGEWGSKTQSALMQFQQAQGMQATGQLDQQTLASLGIQGGSAAGGQGSMPDQQSGSGAGGMSSRQSGTDGGGVSSRQGGRY